ncbi:DUF4198 domain-containing protein [Caulobacter sp. 602-1]|uniref:DUF4198 domain-containing protein n=1 Tax=unclassified Caulobacter TaxID=2648921 RepID=UPI000F637E1C|nr:DUF4198 domain-containing protein [Caulobacter sp. 602-1]RRN62680.1 DUF4198 domain-containing protein [Caulobacter sp. 602-1]
MIRSLRVGLLGGALLLGLAGSAAQAHSPYLLPTVFDASDRKIVTVQGAFTESFFTPEVVMKSDAYAVIGPDGVRVALTPVYTRELALVEAVTEKPGTYRITTGLRGGRVAKAALVKGEWQFFEGDKAPADAIDMQSLTMADVYVTRGAPSDAALAPIGKGLEFHAITHPSKIVTGQDAVFEVLFDGKPLAGQPITVQGADDRYADTKSAPRTVTSDAKGRFVLKVDRSGIYQAQTRYRIAPAAAGQPGQSFTYALTFESLR